MWLDLSVVHDGFSKKVLSIRKTMSNRKTEIKTVDQCHRDGRTEGRKEGHGRGGEGPVSGRERDSEAWLLDDPHKAMMLQEVEHEAVLFGMGYFVGCFIVGCK